MGHMNYYCHFMKDYASIAKTIFTLIGKFEWCEEAVVAFERLKKLLASTPILRSPECNVIFYVYKDASGFAIGSILTQPREHKMDYPIYFSNRQLNKAKQNYTTTKREGLAMIYSCRKFRHYLLAKKFKFFMDHRALLYLVNKSCTTGRITRWLLGV